MSSTPSLAPLRSLDQSTVAGDAFDRIAARYDHDFTESLIGRLQREQVWRQIDGLFSPGERILDLGCGTGVDAIHLARRGCQVHAVDASAQMIIEANRKIATAGLTKSITTQSGAMEGTWDRQSCLSTRLQSAHGSIVLPTSGALSSKEDRQDCLSHPFDGALSNFGALNCVADLRPLAAILSRVIRPGGHLALCLISRFCLWETASHGLKAKFTKAARRWTNSGRAAASLDGSQQFPVYYHAVREVRQAFEPDFKMAGRRGIGIFVPPTYLEATARRAPRLAKFAHQADQAIAPWPGFRAIADHTLLVFKRGSPQ